ncbi:hypothetical protein Q3G72_027390 [Acer saccharum]|nr:hypothetical protein Q3G72_027390 [Acer saccharum]
MVRAYTAPTYSTRLEEGSLSFLVQNILVEFANDEKIIYATFVLPKNMTTVNHVWQDGPFNDDNSLGIHALTDGNVRSLAIWIFFPDKLW